MKKKILLNLLLLPSVVLFTACSIKTAKPEIKNEQIKISNIIGLDITKSAPVHSAFIDESFSPPPVTTSVLPLAQTYPMEKEYPLLMCETYEPLYSEYPQFDMVQDIESYDPSLRVEAPTTIYEVIESEEQQPNYITSFKQKSPIRACKSYNSRSSHIEDVESSAKQLLGIKYVWGATGPYRYDCSGFTQKIYRDAGINIPRISRDQAKVGKYISYKNLIKGDMVFFDTHKKRTGKVTHVGIYLGNGNFIHASSAAKKVVIFNFNEKKFYKKRFLWGRRVIRDRGQLASL